MSTKSEFSSHANDYDNNNIIQRIVSKALVREITHDAKNILELGCGSGQIFREVTWDYNSYTAIDFSQTMCDIHPKSKKLDIQCFDFDSENFYKSFTNKKYDLILSSSALQWSKDLPKLVKLFSLITKEFNGVLFTSNTFSSIYEITKQSPSILCLEEIKNSFKDTDSTFELINYKLEFDNRKDLFSYIKNSGVRGNNTLSYKEAKNLYKNYNKNYLEFEVVFIKTHFK